MRLHMFLRSTLLWLIASVLLPLALAQQTTQPQPSTGGSSGGSTGGTTGTGGSTTGGTKVTNTPQPGYNPQSRSPRQQAPYINGAVVLDDGTPAPMGTYIERICSGQIKREAYVGSGGQFSFQVGANNNFMVDASEGLGASDSPWRSAPQTAGGLPDFGMGAATKLMGCELRAQLPGYRSSVVILRGDQSIGPIIDVGTIVLCPLERVPGTTVSATNLQAPKDAKKALERAQKAVQKNKLEEAEKDLRSAVEIYPKYAGAWLALGQVYQRQNRKDDARLAFAKASEADASYVNPYVELARIAAQEQNWQQVADITERALTLDPLDFPDAYVMNSLANFNLKKLDVAEKSARKAQRLDSYHRFPQPYLILASISQQKQDFAGEAQQLRNFLKYAPQAANAGRVRSRLEELEKSGGAVASDKTPRP